MQEVAQLLLMGKSFGEKMMNKYKIYDTKEKRFLGLHEAAISNEGNVITFKNGAIYDVATNSNRYTIHYYIGKTDINDKKIYDDCSIIEFDFIGFGDNESVKYNGFIKWNKSRFRYDIETISHGDKDGDNYIFDLGKCIDRIKNIKIIGTLQEKASVCGSCHGDGEYEVSAGSHSFFVDCHCIKNKKVPRHNLKKEKS